MTLYLAAVSPSRSRPKSSAAAALTEQFLGRAAQYVRCEEVFQPSEAALFTWLDRQGARTSPHLILLDSRGTQMTSEQFAAHIRSTRDAGTQTFVVAIGPADGWTAQALARAAFTLSLGKMTLPHELARAVRRGADLPRTDDPRRPSISLWPLTNRCRRL